ncbi:MAG: hypothetical protein KDD10_10650 [Phaeodactylibacter sp.]|nr:hypothetical protein [Phaeodactylibacter sp.]MCB9296990.1 hypothetical protein [Lewinellaceae bacterium]
MSFFDRLSNGWKLGMASFGVIRENPSLMLFPVLSGASLLFICLTFFGGIAAMFGFQLDAFFSRFETGGEWLAYAALFIFYLVNFTVIVFFNVGLVHCTRLIMDGREAKVGDGIAYSISRLNAIVSWAILAATVGVILKTLEDRLGAIGQIIIGIVGIVWSVATFFVVPVIAYEDVTPIEAVKRSGRIVKEKWGEAIGANFSFGLFYFLGIIAIVAISVLLFFVHPIVAIVAGVLSFLFLATAVSAAKTVFLAAVYRHVNDEPVEFYDSEVLDNVFVPKKK